MPNIKKVQNPSLGAYFQSYYSVKRTINFILRITIFFEQTKWIVMGTQFEPKHGRKCSFLWWLKNWKVMLSPVKKEAKPVCRGQILS